VILAKALKDFAMKLPQSKREYHLQQNKDYKRDVYRIIDINSTKCYYGFIYVNNQSGYDL
jgi:23S rRNA C2498 (ribose-2'-O)-methylase RlmM